MNPSYKFVDCTEGRTIVVGDIHGCYAELQLLLNKIDFSDKDVVISVGDMLDRGPCSWEVAQFFREVSNCYSVVGNHERRVSGVIKGSSGAAWSQLHTLSKIRFEERYSWSEWLDTLPAVIETPHAIVTHARINPMLDYKAQDSVFTCAVGGKDTRIELDENGIPKWFHNLKRTSNVLKPICIGHISYSKIELVKNELYALDTEAVKGGQLTAIELPDCSIVSVPVTENYYKKSYAEWIQTKMNTTNIMDISFKKYMTKKDNLIFMEAFYKALNECNFEERSKRLIPVIINKFGEIPENGQERGKYILQIDNHITNPAKKAIVKTILTKGSIMNEVLIKIPFIKSINEIEKIFRELENESL